ncbi:uncharacterized protein LOC128855503 [Anastrepha ludens]|uniref:uncharacterized protein LOC128855503 n=1 Tax=Anastrepha ludens TaxID=28586 RepID=UPI0023B10EA5|nr:uncharacterized protein LOC128855503 [Anastrepha ludens]
MAPPPKSDFEFIILSLTLTPPTRSSAPRARKDKSTIKVEERDWFFRTMVYEKEKLPRGTRTRFTHWQIKTDEADLFMINNHRFENLILVLGTEAYWIYYHNFYYHHRVKATRELRGSYCGCCFDQHYRPIVEVIQKWTSKKIAQAYLKKNKQVECAGWTGEECYCCD